MDKVGSLIQTVRVFLAHLPSSRWVCRENADRHVIKLYLLVSLTLCHSIITDVNSNGCSKWHLLSFQLIIQKDTLYFFQYCIYHSIHIHMHLFLLTVVLVCHVWNEMKQWPLFFIVIFRVMLQMYFRSKLTIYCHLSLLRMKKIIWNQKATSNEYSLKEHLIGCNDGDCIQQLQACW